MNTLNNLTMLLTRGPTTLPTAQTGMGFNSTLGVGDGVGATVGDNLMFAGGLGNSSTIEGCVQRDEADSELSFNLDMGERCEFNAPEGTDGRGNVSVIGEIERDNTGLETICTGLIDATGSSGVLGRDILMGGGAGSMGRDSETLGGTGEGPEVGVDPMSNHTFDQLHELAKSKKHFSVLLVRKLFTREQLNGRSVYGGRSGKLGLDKILLERVKGVLFGFYPTDSGNRQREWQDCVTAINSYLRGLVRKQRLR